MMVRTIVASSGSMAAFVTNERSILSVLIGNCCSALRLEYPVPKSSMDRCTPIERSSSSSGSVRSASSMRVVSVISSSTHDAGTLYCSNTERQRGMKLAWLNSLSDRLIATRPGSLTLFCHVE